MPHQFALALFRRFSSRRVLARPACGRIFRSAAAAAPSLPARFGMEPLESRTFLSAWFVSTNGSDASAGTLGAPFRTIQRAASIAQPGDTVEVRGGIYHETVRPANSGTGGAPITFTAYNNESVTIDGADPITGWSIGPGYHATMGWDLGLGNNQVFVDGQAINEARWPNASLDPSHPTYAHANAASATGATTTIYDGSLSQPAGYWVGGVIHFLPGQGWVSYTATVTASGPGYVTFNYQPNSQWETVSGGTAYFLAGKVQAIDTAGEWYRDPSNGQLTVWPPASDNPANHLVEAKQRLYAFDLSGVSNVTVRGLNLIAATINTDRNSGDIVLDHLNAQYLSQFLNNDGWNPPSNSGIVLNGDGDLLENSQIAYSAGDGVYVGGNNVRVINNIIHDVDTSASDSAGVRIYGSNALVDHNTIYNTGRNGIDQFGWQSTIQYNAIHDALLQTSDGGGIYTVRSSGFGATIAYNRIFNVRSGGFGGVGIYLDDNSSNYTVHHNITWNVDAALKLNSSSLSQHIYNNTFDAVQYGIGRNSGAADWSGTAIENNIFTRWFQAVGAWATIQSNIYAGTDPRFANPGGGDYSLQSSSPAIDAGMVIAPYTNGYRGPRPDAGALEYGQSAFSSGAAIDDLPTPPTFSVASAAPPPIQLPPSPAVSGPATTTVDATKFDAAQGIGFSYGGIGYLDNGDWAQYKRVNFGAGGFSSVNFHLAVPQQYAGQRIELHIDSANGPVIGTLVTQPSGSWSRFILQGAAIKKTTGFHDLYVCFVGWYGLGNIDWFQFS